MSSNALYWIRNDQRLDDQSTLAAFSKEPRGVCASFITRSFERAGEFRRQFYLESLTHFHEQLRANGLATLHFECTVQKALEVFIVEHKITSIYFSEEPTTEEKKEEDFVRSLAKKMNLAVYSFQQDTLILKSDVPFTIKDLPEPFTKFRKIVEAQLCVREPLIAPTKWPQSIEVQYARLKELGITTASITALKQSLVKPLAVPLIGGEAAAQKHLHEYFWELDRAQTYKDTRNGLLNWNDSTKFSPWLATGNVSPRRIYKELKNYEEQVIANDSTYWIFFELLWRDYFHFYAEQMGARLFTKQVRVPADPAAAEKLFMDWYNGNTGDSFIDAHMKELLQTGWMSNRGRQNTASYLAKKIQLPWVWGAEWFEKMLIDYDAANNWGNWSYFSGVGTDPRDRAFNTQTQAKAYDPDGEYQKKWLKDFKSPLGVLYKK